MSQPLPADKMSVTVPAEIASEVRSRAGRGQVSAYVTRALMRQLEHDRLGQLVADLEDIHGPVTEEELVAARAEWPTV
jgi:hypothetical protein